MAAGKKSNPRQAPVTAVVMTTAVVKAAADITATADVTCEWRMSPVNGDFMLVLSKHHGKECLQ